MFGRPSELPACAIGIRLSMANSGGHIKHHLVLVAQIDGGQVWILLAPLGDVILVALETLEEVIFAKVRENVGALLRHQHARIFRVGQIDLGELFGIALAIAVEFAHQSADRRPCAPARDAGLSPGSMPVRTGNE